MKRIAWMVALALLLAAPGARAEETSDPRGSGEVAPKEEKSSLKEKFVKGRDAFDKAAHEAADAVVDTAGKAKRSVDRGSHKAADDVNEAVTGHK